MTPTEFREARDKLGLSVRQMAYMLGVTQVQIRRMEMDQSTPSARKVSPQIERLMAAYLAGYRPIAPGLE